MKKINTITLEQATINALLYKLNESNLEDNDDLYIVDVYLVCMDTYSGKRLYLAQTNTNIQNWRDAKTYEWQFSRQGAMEFDTEEEATEFANHYFKNFNKWYIHKGIAYR